MATLKYYISVVILIVLLGCQSYQIPIASFKNQFAPIDSSSLKLVRVKGPAGDISEYLVNPIKQIRCVDKNGNNVSIPNSPSIEARITTSDGKKTTFYFDRMLIRNDSILGYRSRFFGLPKSIALSEVSKIEVQDGYKRFRYVNK